MTAEKNAPRWSDLKAKLADFDRAGLLALIQDLYTASKDNQAFLHARFALGEEVLKPYKTTITQWINPADARKPISVAKAKKAIADYKKALGLPEGLAELTVFYCEEVFDFLADCGMEDAGYFDALVRMFEQALKYVGALPKAQQSSFIYRLNQIHRLGREFGWGLDYRFDQLWAEADLSGEA